MTRQLTAAVALAVLLSGCQAPCERTEGYTRLPDSSDAWNTNHLLDVDAEATTPAQLDAFAASMESHYWRFAQHEGMAWPPTRSDAGLAEPDRWHNGGDTGIFTGSALAGWVFKYAVTKDAADLAHVEQTLRGVWILTHATGKHGVICRNAARIDMEAKFGYPDDFAHRKPFVNKGPVLADPFGGHMPGGGFWYYTRATKDQLTGIVLGLSAAWALVDPADAPAALKTRTEAVRDVVKRCAAHVYAQLLEHKWYIRDENGKNDTSADYVKPGLLRTALLGLVHASGAADVKKEYDAGFTKTMDMRNTLAYVDRLANYDAYYGHNLRTSRLLGLWLLEKGERREELAEYMDLNVWRFTAGHRNAFFCFTRNAMHPTSLDRVADGVRGLKSMVHRPIRMWSSPYIGQKIWPGLSSAIINCTEPWVLDPHLRKPSRYWVWQKRPWDTGQGDGFDKQGWGDLMGIDYITAYWLGKLFKLL